MKIGMKLALGFSVLILAILVSTFVAIINLGSLNGEVDLLVNDRFPKTVWVNNIIDDINNSARALRNPLLSDDPEVMARTEERLNNNLASELENLEKLEKTITTPEGIALLKEVRNSLEEYGAPKDRFLDNIKNGNLDAAKQSILSGELREAQDHFLKSLVSLIDYQTQLVEDQGKKAIEVYESSRNLLIIVGVVAVILAIIIAIWIISNITKPLNKAVTAANSISAGNLKVDLAATSKDETGQLLNAMEAMTKNVQSILSDTDNLINKTKLGQLDARGDASKYKGEWSNLVSGINELVDAFVAPINVTAEYVDRISKGDMPPKITEEYKGDFNEIKNNLNLAIDSIQALIDDSKSLATAASAGKLDVRADATKHQGDFRDIINGVNSTLDNVIGPLNVAAEYMDRISKGDMPPKITDNYNGDFNEIKNNLNVCIDSIDSMIADSKFLAKAAKEGKLDTRADASKHQGDFREIVEGVNAMLDNVIGPLNVAAEYMDRISKGDMPPKITDNYNGDFNEIKNNLNVLIDANNNIIDVAKQLSVGNTSVELKKRSNQDDLIAALLAVIENNKHDAENIVRMSKGDLDFEVKIQSEHDEMAKSCQLLQTNLGALISDAKMLANAAVAGKLDVRADATKHQGDFRVIVDGVNATLDNVIGPLNVAAEYVDRISKGDMPPKITDNYNGDFNEIKNNLNVCIDSLNGLISEMNHMSEQHDLGDIDVIINVDNFNGAYKDMARGVNEMVNGHIAVKKKAMACFKEFGEGNFDAEIETFPGKKVFINNIIEEVRFNLKNFIKEMINMSEQHDLGDIDIVIDETIFKGGFKDMARGVNGMVNGHISVKKKAMACFMEFGDGNLDAEIEQFPGKKKFINETIEVVRANIKQLIADSLMLAKAAREGNIKVRADENKHKGDFREIVKGINDTINSITAPLNEAGQVFGVMATGDLRVRMHGDYQGDLIKFKNDINTLGESLTNLIAEVMETVENTASSAMEISSVAESLAAATQEQSSQADEVASAVEEMSRTVTENAMSANNTANMAQENGKIAQEGGSVVELTVRKMRDIATVVERSAENIQKLGESSKEIGEIISVIDDIADQTNLLALNAAIEAARAGEQGRGFAVVADEVRKLAERTTEATKKIADMIKGIQAETDQAVNAMNKGTEEVKAGIEYADNAGKSLNTILSSTQDLMDMINQIAAASEEQSATSEQISKNVLSISKVTSESAHRVEDVARTSEDLARLTEHLRELMNQFKIDANGSISGGNAKSIQSSKGAKSLPAPNSYDEF